MATDIFDFPSSPSYSTDIPKLKRTDPADAETVFNPLFQQVLYNIHYAKLLAEGAGAAMSLELVVPADAWVLDTYTNSSGEVQSYFYADVAAENVTEDLIPAGGGVTFLSQAAAGECSFNGQIQTLDGSIRFYALQPPTSAIDVIVVLVGAAGAVSSGGGSTGDGSTYTLPIASAYTLGGVKVGDGLNVSSTGVLSVDTTTLTTELAATDEEVDEALEDALGG